MSVLKRSLLVAPCLSESSALDGSNSFTDAPFSVQVVSHETDTEVMVGVEGGSSYTNEDSRPYGYPGITTAFSTHIERSMENGRVISGNDGSLDEISARSLIRAKANIYRPINVGYRYF